MALCLRIDLDYVPWDSPDAREFGHGEPAAFLRLLDLARGSGYRFHFFASNRVLRAFPVAAEAALNEGHDLDWFCKHPRESARMEEAFALFRSFGHVPVGLAVNGDWPADGAAAILGRFRFLSAGAGSTPTGIRHFPVETQPAREAHRLGTSLRAWTETLKRQMRDAASRNLGLTVVARPQVLARLDPHLNYLREVLDLADAVGMEIRTLRELASRPG